MRRTNVVELKPTKRQRLLLKEMMLLSSCVHNMANYATRQAIFSKTKSPSFYDLRKILQSSKDYQLLGRSYALPRIQLFSETESARHKLINSKCQHHVGLQKYLKNRKTKTTIPSFLVMDGPGYRFVKNTVLLPLSHRMRKKYNLKSFCIEYNGILRWKGKQCRSHISFKNKKFYLYQSIELDAPVLQSGGSFVGIDLGIKNLITLASSNGAAKVIGSKRFYAQYQYHTNKIAQEQQRLALIHKRTSNRLKRLYARRTTYVENLQNNVVKKALRFCKRNKVTNIILGDVTGIRDNNNQGAFVNSMLHNYWAYDAISTKLRCKAEQYGIQLRTVTEEYTTVTCPVCGQRNAPMDRLYVCSNCVAHMHRDIVGAINIMRKGMHDPISKSVHGDERIPLRGVG
jgi:putative transposase